MRSARGTPARPLLEHRRKGRPPLRPRLVYQRHSGDPERIERERAEFERQVREAQAHRIESVQPIGQGHEGVVELVSDTDGTTLVVTMYHQAAPPEQKATKR